MTRVRICSVFGVPLAFAPRAGGESSSEETPAAIDRAFRRKLKQHAKGSLMSELEDHEEIRQLLARYCHTVDAGDADGFADCFSEDGVFDANGDLIEGREAIRKWCQGYRPRVTPLRHVTANPLITVNGDEAEASSYLFLLTPREQRGVLTTGTYRDRLRRE